MIFEQSLGLFQAGAERIRRGTENNRDWKKPEIVSQHLDRDDDDDDKRESGQQEEEIHIACHKTFFSIKQIEIKILLYGRFLYFTILIMLLCGIRCRIDGRLCRTTNNENKDSLLSNFLGSTGALSCHDANN